MVVFDVGNTLSATAIGTARFLLFFDQLFDSMNGSSVNPTNGKLLRCAVKRDSAHHVFWKEALPVLRSVKFVGKYGKYFVPPSINNWIKTLQGISRFHYFFSSSLKYEKYSIHFLFSVIVRLPIIMGESLSSRI